MMPSSGSFFIWMQWAAGIVLLIRAVAAKVSACRQLYLLMHGFAADLFCSSR